MATQIDQLPLVKLTVAASQNGDLLVQIAFKDALGNPTSLAGISFSFLLLKTPASAGIGVLDAAGYLINGGASGGISLAVPAAQWARAAPGTYTGDLVATADGKTEVVGVIDITQSATGGCQIAAFTSSPRNAATAAAVGYIPGPGWNQYKGDYSNTAFYVANDVTYFAFSSWIALGPTTGNAPAVGSPYWHLVAPGVDPAVVAGATALTSQVAALQAAQQPASGVAITGGSINGTTIGASTPAGGAFTTMSTTGAASFGSTVSMLANSLSLSYLAQLPAGMLLGNPTGGTANVTPAAVSAYLDYAYGNPAPRGTVIVKGASGFVARTPSATGQGLFFDGTDTNFTAPATVTSPPQPARGRLTLTSGVPVLAANVSAATSIFYTPYIGALVPLWNGSIFVPTSFAEVSQALSDATKSPSAAAAAQVYDLFAWSDGGTFRVTRGPAWSAGATAGSATARGTGAGSTALSRNAGVLVNQAAITNGPAAGYGTYVGTIATDAGGATVSFNTGSIAAGGGAASIGLWNMYNRVSIAGCVRDNTNSWSYATAAWRAANGSASARVTFVIGLAEDVWTARYATIYNTGNAAAAGIGVDSTTAYTGTTVYNVAAAGSQAQSAEASAIVLGQHYFSAIEYAASGTMVAYGNSGVSAYLQTGLNWLGRY